MVFIIPPGVNAPSAEVKRAMAAFHIQISEYFKIFDYWINLSYPSYFYFVT